MSLTRLCPADGRDTCWGHCALRRLVVALVSSLSIWAAADAQTPFVRGDSNSDGAVQISDAVFTLSELFTSGDSTTCRDAADANDDGSNDISDAIYLLQFLFSSGPVPPLPFPGCGVDRTEDTLDCVSSPCPPLVGEIEVARSLEWGVVPEGQTRTKSLTVRNAGTGPLVVESASIDSPDFELVAIPGAMLPLTLEPGQSRSLTLAFSAPTGGGGSSVAAQLTFTTNDVDDAMRVVELEATVVPASPPLVTTTVVGAETASISLANCSDVTGSVSFSSGSLDTDAFRVRLTDSAGSITESADLPAPLGAGEVAFSGIDACTLGDGVIAVEVVVLRAGALLATATGTPTVKNTTPLTAPELDPLPPVSVLSAVEICGSAPASTTVTITGGSSAVSIELDASTTTFCVTVPLRPNTENILVASAVSTVGPVPHPVATAAPISVAHVDPSSVVVAEASSVPLTPEEIEELVVAGIIDLDDPDSYSVQMFTIVLTIGSFPVTISQPVPVPTTPGSVGYGGGVPITPSGGSGTPIGGSGSGWTPSPGVTPSGPPPSPSGCLTGCSQIVVITSPTGETIPGVIIIDGRIRTLREFFQVTIALFNSSTLLDLVDMNTSIVLPPGLTPIAAGLGDDVGEVSAEGMIEEVFLGTLTPGETGIGQYVIRGDVIGTHAVEVAFDGFLGGAALGEPFPISGSAATTVEVHGPPHLAVTVSHPSVVGGPDVTFGQIYELLVEITNESAVPALYTSLEMFVGGDAVLVDEFDEPIVGASVITELGHIQPGQSVLSVFRVQALVEGEIIACQGLTSQGLSLTVDTGPDGTECAITTAYPAIFEPLPVDLPPVLLGVSPAPSSGGAPVTTSLFATLTPRADCIEADTWTSVITGPIDPLDPGAGIQVLSASLVEVGTFYLEELDPFGNPVRHIPLDLTLEDPPAGGTTIAVQRLGLASPLSQFFLSPNTTYRATLVGGPGGICSLASGAEMASDFVWTFSTDQTCDGSEPLTVQLSTPLDSATDVPLNTPIELLFGRRMNPTTFAFDPLDLGASTIGFYAGGTIESDDLVGGTPIEGQAVFTSLGQRLVYQPLAPLAPETTIHVRVTSGLADVCGDPLDTGSATAQIFSFTTPPPDTTPPVEPIVNPIPTLSSAPSIQVSGTSEPLSIVTVTGGASSASTNTSMSGLFSLWVPLDTDTTQTLAVQASDASGNLSPLVTVDALGAPLELTQDATPPMVTSISPAAGAFGVDPSTVFTVEFSESIDPATVNALNFRITGTTAPGAFDFDRVAGDRFTFTPSAPLPTSSMLATFLRKNGVRDLAGNGLTVDFTAPFTTVTGPPPTIDSIAPNSAAQGTSLPAVIQGTGLAGDVDLSIDGSGVQITDAGTDDDTYRDVLIVIEAAAPPGPRTITLTTAGGSATVDFTVLEFIPPPVITEIDPNVGAVGTTVFATIVGEALDDIVDLSIDGTGVTLTDLATGGTTSRDIRLDVDDAAPLGPRTITLTTPGGIATATFEVVPRAVTLVPSVLNLETRATVAVAVSIPTAAGPGGVEVLLSSGDPLLLDVPASVTIAEGATSAGFDVTSLVGAGDTTLDATAVDYDPDSIDVTVNARGFLVTSPLVGLDTTVIGTIQLEAPAPTGGATLDLMTDAPSIVTVVPSALFIAAGQTTATFELTGGLSVGMATLTVDGSADGFDVDTLTLVVTDRIIDTPGTLEVGLESTFSIPIIIAPDPAPAGGVALAVTSSDPSVVEVLTPSVVVPEGTFTAMASVRSLGSTGTANIAVSEPSYAPDVTVVSVTTELAILQSFLDLPAGENGTVFVEIRSGGVAYPAPAGGLVVDLDVSDSSCLLAPTSIVIPEGESLGSFTVEEAPGATVPCGATVAATSTFGSDAIDVELGSVADLGALTLQDAYGIGAQVGEQLQVPYRCILASGAHGGVTVQVQSSDPARVQLTANQFALGSAVIEVPVAPGATFFDFWIQGQSDGSGLATITASQARFTPAAVAYETVPSALDFASVDTSHTVSSQTDINDDPFVVRTGIPNGSGSLSRIQAVRGGAPISIEVSTSDAAVASLTTSSPPQLGDTVTVPIGGGSQSTPSSLATGGAALTYPDPVTGVADLIASASGFEVDLVSISVTVVPAEISFTDAYGHQGRIGAGLQYRQRLQLSGPDHGGVTVQIDSSDATKSVLSTTSDVRGTGSLSVFIPDGQSILDFWVQGFIGNPGPVTLTATEPSFVSGTVDLTMVDPILDLQSLSTSHSTTSASLIPDDTFTIRVGRPNLAGTTFGQSQVVAPGSPMVVTVTSSDVGVGQLVTTAITGAAVTTSIAPESSNTPSQVSQGGVALRFDPPTTGLTTIEATAVGVAPFTTATQDVTVTVTPATLSFSDAYGTGTRLGAGLQGRYRVTLSGADHGGVTIEVTSSDPTRALVAPDGTTAGSGTLAVFVPNGQSIAEIWLQGVPGAAGPVTLTASEASFTDATLDLEVVAPVLHLFSLSSSHITTSAALINDDAFTVRTGVTNVAGTSYLAQSVSAGAGDLSVSVTSSDVSIGQLETMTMGPGASVDLVIPINDSSTPAFSQGGVRLQFDPPTTGTTTIEATATGFDPSYDSASQTVSVTVNPATLTVQDWEGASGTIGGGLQSTYRVTLSGGDHGGVTIVVTSDDESVLRVSANSTTPGTDSVNLFVPNGQTSTPFFYAQGVAGTTGSATITATHAAFTSSNESISVVTPVLQVSGLASTQTTTTAATLSPDSFQVRTGISSTGTSITRYQSVSGAGPLSVTVTSSDTAVAQLATTGSSGTGSVMVTVDPGSSSTSGSGTGLLQLTFDPTTTGGTTVDATASGFDPSFPGASQAVMVTVDPASISLIDAYGDGLRLGGGLQARYRVQLSGPDHGGVNVLLESSNSLQATLSSDPLVAGTASISVFIADGQTLADFFVHGVSGATGSTTITATEASFTSDTLVIDLVQPVLHISSLASTQSAGGSDDAFSVWTGILNPAGTAIDRFQEVSAAGPLQVLIESGTPVTAELVTLTSTGASVTVEVPVNRNSSDSTVAAGGVAFRPLTAGSTIISASAIGFGTYFGSSQTVTVTP